MSESQNIEWKEPWRDEYLKWICGFANAQGGKIYIGMNDDGEVVGVQIRVYDDKIMIANDCVFPEDWTVENLMKPHKSRPYNPLIASTFYRAGYIESWGRGIEKIKESCEASKNPQPEYLIHHEDFMITFFAGKTTRTPTQTELSELVLAVIREHPEYSQKQIAEQLDWKRDRVKYYVKRLKDEKIIRRVGTTHKGYWEIID